MVTLLIVTGTFYYFFEIASLALAAGVITSIMTFIGSIYPDIDHHKSIPRRRAVRVFQLVSAGVIIGVSVLFWSEINTGIESIIAQSNLEFRLPPMAISGVSVGVVSLIAIRCIDPAIGILTDKHRGWTHNPLVNAGVVGTLLAGGWVATGSIAISTTQRGILILAGVCFYFGSLIHLGLDGELI